MRGLTLTTLVGGRETKVQVPVPAEVLEFIESLSAATNSREEDVLAEWITTHVKAVVEVFPTPTAEALKQYLKLEEQDT